jgi:abhydrolase domain-containing protein 17
MTLTSLIRGFLIVFVLYLACAALARLLAARALYYPEMGSRRAPEGMQKIRASDGTEIAILHLRNPKARFTIWFFHGNAEDLGDGEAWLHALRDAGFSVLAFDYPGYGLSTGRPSESTLVSSARVVREHLRNTLNVTPAQTLIYGRSLGGGPAVQMATEEKVGGVILQSTFTSVYRVVTQKPVLPFDFFENVRKLGHIACPILVMHGERDEVIPFAHGKALFAAAAEPKRFFPVPDARHNDFLLVAGRAFWDELRAFSDVCARRIDSAP